MIAAALVVCAIGTGCKGANSTGAKAAGEEQRSVVETPVFDGDSAYAYVKAQCDFGPRVPNTAAHKQCGDYLVATLQGFGAEVIEQKAPVTTFDGTSLEMRNIIGQWNGKSEQRVVLLAHWDSRPWADSDSDPANHKKPVMGANDGASGVGVLLELARVLAANQPMVGIDIVLVDAEDWGDSGDDDSWALGAQYWAAHPHRAGYKPIFGILLDMVGAADAQFTYEYYSQQHAPQVNKEVWAAANAAGFGSYFVARQGGAITDDHVAVNNAGIPCIDIIDMRQQSAHGFFDGWHTTHDTMENISAPTLKAVGQTIVNYLWQF